MNLSHGLYFDAFATLDARSSKSKTVGDDNCGPAQEIHQSRAL